MRILNTDELAPVAVFQVHVVYRSSGGGQRQYYIANPKPGCVRGALSYHF